jgi:hypothetical protein
VCPVFPSWSCGIESDLEDSSSSTCMTTLPEAVVISIRGDAAVIPELGSSCVMETFRVRRDDRDEDVIEEEAGDTGSSGSSISILPESGAELVPLPRPAEWCM